MLDRRRKEGETFGWGGGILDLRLRKERERPNSDQDGEIMLLPFFTLITLPRPYVVKKPKASPI